MISVQNLLLRLNGNKWMFLLMVGLLMGSCDTIKLATNTSRPTKKRRPASKNRNTVKVDTVKWRKIPEKGDGPITDDLPMDSGYDLTSYKKDVYNVAMMIPLRSRINRNKTKWTKRAFRFVNYYAGVQMAMEDLNRKGKVIALNVYDSEYSPQKVQQLWRKKELRSADVVIGPYHKQAMSYSVKKAKEYEKTLVSPWISAKNLTTNNPFYIQIRAGLFSHYYKMLDNAYKDFDDDQIYILLKKGDLKKRNELMDIAGQMNIDERNIHLNFLYLDLDTVQFGKYVVDTTIMDQHDKSVFILPYAGSKDNDFVYDFLQKLELIKNNRNVIIYGMYKWLDYTEEIYEYINRMDVRICVNGLVDPNNEQVKKFKERYYEKFGALPTDDAIEGYDLMLFIGEQLKKSGNKFHLTAHPKKQVGLQTVYDIQPIINTSGDKLRPDLDYYENAFVELIDLRHYRFERLK